MLQPELLHEFQSVWCPHMTDAGLNRITDLLDQASPMLVHGSFTATLPRGCLASHIAWNHPKTTHLYQDAGVVWLTRVAKLNPATSRVVMAWDRHGVYDWLLRSLLLGACRLEWSRRRRYRRAARRKPVVPG